jgi:hypothetical protein
MCGEGVGQVKEKYKLEMRLEETSMNSSSVATWKSQFKHFIGQTA